MSTGESGVGDDDEPSGLVRARARLMRGEVGAYTECEILLWWELCEEGKCVPACCCVPVELLLPFIPPPPAPAPLPAPPPPLTPPLLPPARDDGVGEEEGGVPPKLKIDPTGATNCRRLLYGDVPPLPPLPPPTLPPIPPPIPPPTPGDDER